MKSVVMLWIACLQEAGDQCHVRIHRDLAYALSRVEKEGPEFLGVTLPNFEKDLLTAVSRGYAGSDLFLGFSQKGGLPKFLSGFLCQIFDSNGMLRDDADSTVLRTVRQILLLVSKTDAPYSEESKEKAYDAYIATDALLDEISDDFLSVFRAVSRNLLGTYFSELESRLWSGEWTPRNSSGALATRESYNSRFRNCTWTERLQEVFPYWEDLAVSPREVIDRRDEFSVLARNEEIPVRVTLVPKTMKGPRIIAMEPVWMQYTQQGILALMTEVLSKEKNKPLADIFSWLDQTPNRELAREGSIDGSFATIDLSEASDRVSLELASALLSGSPFLKACVLACRSEEAKLPDGRKIALRKFASMGSALCFPIESMVFFIISSIAYAQAEGIDPLHLRIRDLPRMRVYGDDLIVPNTAAQTLCSLLEAYGLKVNARKSFTTGLFRESCGSDWFKGKDVSIFKIRAPFPSTKHQLDLIEQAIDFHNRAYYSGWFVVAEAAENILRDAIGNVPRAPIGTPAAALWSWEGPFVTRINPNLHRIEYKVFVFRQVKPVDPLDGYGALRKFFASVDPNVNSRDECFLLSREPREKDHLQRDGRSRYAGIHTGWWGR